MADWSVISVQPRDHLRLAVGFKDGTTGWVRFEPSALTGVFRSLVDPELFRQVFIDHGVVTWPGKVDLAPDAMHEEIQTRGEWVIS